VKKSPKNYHAGRKTCKDCRRVYNHNKYLMTTNQYRTTHKIVNQEKIDAKQQDDELAKDDPALKDQILADLSNKMT